MFPGYAILTLLAWLPSTSLSCGEALSQDDELLATIPEDLSLDMPPYPDLNTGEMIRHKSRIHWSAGATKVAYVGYKSEKAVPIIGDDAFKSYHYVNPPRFSRDGKVVAFRVGRRISKTKERWWVLLNGKEKFPSDWIGDVALSPDGKRTAFWVTPGMEIQSDGIYAQKPSIFVRDGKKGKKWRDGASLQLPRFSDDGKTILTAAMGDDGWSLLRVNRKGEKPLGEPLPMIYDFVLRPDGKEASTVAMVSGAMLPPGAPPGLLPRTEDQETTLLRGKRSVNRELGSAGCPEYSPDGKYLAFKYRKDDRMGIGIDGGSHAKATHDFVSTPVFSSDSKRVAYAVYEGGDIQAYWSLQRGGDRQITGGICRVASRGTKEKKERLGPEFESVRDIVFSPKGDVVAYAAKKGEHWHLVVDDRVGPAFDEVGAPSFQDRGKVVVYGARDGREIWRKSLALD